MNTFVCDLRSQQLKTKPEKRDSSRDALGVPGRLLLLSCDTYGYFLFDWPSTLIAEVCMMLGFWWDQAPMYWKHTLPD